MEELGTFVQQFIKAIKDHKLYSKPSEHTVEFLNKAYEALTKSLEEMGTVILAINEDKIMHDSNILYENPKRITSVPLFLYRNGIRSFTFIDGIEKKELEDFANLIASKEYKSNVGLIEDLWRLKFDHIIYHAVEVRGKEGESEIDDSIKKDVGVSADKLSIVPVTTTRTSKSLSLLQASVSSYAPKLKIDRKNQHHLLLASIRDLLAFEKNPKKRIRIFSIFKSSVAKFIPPGEISLLLKSKKLLEYLLEREKRQELRNVLYEIFDIISSKEAIQLYLHALSSADSISTKKEALNLLGFIGVNIVNDLLNELEITEDDEISEAIISLLEGIFVNNKDTLVFLLNSTDENTLNKLLTIVKRSEDPYYIPCLESLMEKDGSDKVKDVLFSLLPREKMIKYVEHPEESIRILALKGMKEIWGEKEFKVISNRIRSRDFWYLPEEERRNLLFLLSTLKVSDTIEIFKRILSKWHFFNQEVFKTKRMAIEALSKIGTEDSISLINRYSKSRYLRDTVRRILKKYEG